MYQLRLINQRSCVGALSKIYLRDFDGISLNICDTKLMLSLDLNSKMLYSDNQSIHITRTEFLLLALLLKSPEQILARSIVLSACTLPEGIGSDQVLNLHVSRLRKKLREAGAGEHLFFTPGFGLSMNHPSTFGNQSESFSE